MNIRTGAVLRSSNRLDSQFSDSGAWLYAIAIALAVTVVGAFVLPAELLLPAVALALFGAAVVAVAVIRLCAPERLESAMLFAGMLFFAGIVALVAGDLDQAVAFLR